MFGNSLGVLFVVRCFFDRRKGLSDCLSGSVQDRRGIFAAAALEFCSRTAGALGVSARASGLRRGGRGGRGGITKRSQPGFAVALGELVLGEGHEGVHIGRTGLWGRLRGRFWSCLLVGELFLDGSAFLQLAEFVEGSAEDQVGLSPCSVYRFLLFFGSFVHHGVEVEIVDGGESFFDEAATPETPSGSHDFGGEGLFDRVFGGQLVH